MATAKDSAKKAPKEAKKVKTIESLNEELDNKRQDLMTSLKSLKSGELVNPRVIRSLKKDIARVLTDIRAIELTNTKESK